MHLKSKCLKYVRVTEFSIETESRLGAKGEDNEVKANFTVDGSGVQGKRIAVKIVKPKINVFCM